MNFFYQSRVESFSSFLSNDNTYPAHLHRQVEIMYVLSGKLNINIEEQTYELAEGDISVTFPDKIHSLHTADESDVLLMVFDIDFLHEFRSAFTEYIPVNPVLQKDKLTQHGINALNCLISLSKNMPATADIPDADGNYKQSVVSTDVTDAEDSKDMSSNLLYSKSYLTILLTDILSYIELEKRETCNDRNICENILIYLDKHFKDNISLESTAKELGISKFYLSQIFSNRLHTSFPTYVTARRLDYAEKLLTTTTIPVSEIAYQSGFSSPRTFFRSFQNTYQITPHQYRKSHSRF